MAGKEVAKTQPKQSLVAKMAAEHSVEAADFYEAITKTIFPGANKAQLMTLLMVADRYHLDPSTSEIYAFPAKGGGIVPVVGFDGWVRLAHQHPQYDGEEMRWAEKVVVPDGGKRCPEWCEIVVYRKDTSHPTVIREYLDECYRKTSPWQTHTKRMLRHKTMIQGYRVAFGFSGIKDEDEAQRIVTEGTFPEAPEMPSGNAAKARKVLASSSQSQKPSDAADAPVEAISEVEPEYEDAVVVDENGEVLDVEMTADDDDFQRGVDLAKQALGAVEEEPPAEERRVLKATRKQLEAIAAAKARGKWSDELFSRLLSEEFHVARTRDLDREQALRLVKVLMSAEADNVQEGLEV